MGPGPDSGSSAPSSAPHSLATSREEEDDDDEESNGRPPNDPGRSRSPRSRLHRRPSLRKSFSTGFSSNAVSLDSIDSNVPEPVPDSARRPRSSRGSQKWSNVRAVMALYSSLRKIKRYTTQPAEFHPTIPRGF
ncbi:hypothetical protein PV328_009977 [Microctonus aethiopoides]|uniref:Uncharacterized protein n=1 Tax=Microctonus aethiopoides TaxID=144406 RepID=A0AA39EZX2_9HYME|nr:hypothetical protein PV328_009977 [Microctonus aethiopoides]